MRGNTNLNRPLKPLNHLFPPLHDLVISPHVKHLPKNLPKKVFSPMQSFFIKKFFLTFQRIEETLCFIFISFSHFLKSIPNFCGANYDLSSKTTQLLFLKSYSIVSCNFPNCFKPELQNHIAKNIKHGDKCITNL